MPPFQAEDGGGLSAVTNSTITVVDINDPPVCDERTIRVNINLTTAIGTDVGQLVCIDWDIDSQYNTIVYTLQDSESKTSYQ